MRYLILVATLAALAAAPARAEGWEPIRNTETGRGAVVCSDDFSECFGLRCVPERGTEFFVMLTAAAPENGRLALSVDGAPAAEKPFVRAGDFGDLVLPYDAGTDAALIAELRRGTALRLGLPEATLEFTLTGSGAAIDRALRLCD